jgi:hypothetical protein
MPNPRKPTQLLALNGGLAKNPARYSHRSTEPASNGPIGDAPVGFNKARRAIWQEITALVPPGVLRRSDRLILELICHLVYDLRAGEITIAGIGQLRQSLASLGMTPADRSRVSAIDSPAHDEWSAFAS